MTEPISGRRRRENSDDEEASEENFARVRIGKRRKMGV